MVSSHHPSEVLLVVGSTNRHKVEEVASFLTGARTRTGQQLRVRGSEALPPGPAIDEDGDTFAANARLKALAYAERASGLPAAERPAWVLADDSGLAVEALGGAPGVRSARYAGPGATDADNNQKLLRDIAGVERERRGAEFVCALSLASVPRTAAEAPQEIATAEGRCRGEVLPAGRGQGGFGYDPLFLVPGLGKTYAEITAVEKNALSHRGNALRSLRRRIEDLEVSA
jgi:XTP/dITP diphosphohydrolase